MTYIEEFKKIVDTSISELKRGFELNLQHSRNNKEFEVELDFSEFTSKMIEELKGETYVYESEQKENFEKLEEKIEYESETLTTQEIISSAPQENIDTKSEPIIDAKQPTNDIIEEKTIMKTYISD